MQKMYQSGILFTDKQIKKDVEAPKTQESFDKKNMKNKIGFSQLK